MKAELCQKVPAESVCGVKRAAADLARRSAEGQLGPVNVEVEWVKPAPAQNAGSGERETASVAFETLHANLEEGMFKGVASAFDSLVDTVPATIFHKGAFAKSIANPERNILILWQHDTSEPIGTPISLRETDVGLEIVGKISDTQRGREALALMRDGAVGGLSIGFDYIDGWFERTKARVVRHITEARLWEVSVVTFPANKAARVYDVHALRRRLPNPKTCFPLPHNSLGVCEQDENGTRIYLRSDLSVGQVLETVAHELHHARVFVNHGRLMTPGEYAERTASMEAEAGAFGREVAAGLDNLRPSFEHSVSDSLRIENERVERQEILMKFLSCGRSKS